MIANDGSILVWGTSGSTDNFMPNYHGGGDGLIYKLNSYLSTENIDFSKNIISIYPNPVADYLVISSGNNNEKIKNLTFFNLEGKIIKEIEGRNKIISCGDLAQGVYLIKAVTDKGYCYTGKFVKQ